MDPIGEELNNYILSCIRSGLSNEKIKQLITDNIVKNIEIVRDMYTLLMDDEDDITNECIHGKHDISYLHQNICSHYLVNKCKYGNLCNKKHIDEKICPYFLNGKCKYSKKIPL